MEAEERRIAKKNKLFIFFNSITTLTLILSILDMVIKNNDKIINFSLFNIILSIALIVLSLIISNYDLSKEAFDFRKSYLELENLMYDSDRYNENELKLEYSKILERHLNHNNLDFIYFKITQRKNNNNNFSYNNFEYLMYLFDKYTLNIIIFIIVIIIIALSYHYIIV
ncbi:SLATT domain-containing protein [Apilactobacillus micheneri]|nr:SLATT domain-containing protein [Apilactobacillus micheneri]